VLSRSGVHDLLNSHCHYIHTSITFTPLRSRLVHDATADCNHLMGGEEVGDMIDTQSISTDSENRHDRQLLDSAVDSCLFHRRPYHGNFSPSHYRQYSHLLRYAITPLIRQSVSAITLRPPHSTFSHNNSLSTADAALYPNQQTTAAVAIVDLSQS